jgi:hypothetical protein
MSKFDLKEILKFSNKASSSERKSLSETSTEIFLEVSPYITLKFPSNGGLEISTREVEIDIEGRDFKKESN